MKHRVGLAATLLSRLPAQHAELAWNWLGTGSDLEKFLGAGFGAGSGLARSWPDLVPGPVPELPGTPRASLLGPLSQCLRVYVKRVPFPGC